VTIARTRTVALVTSAELADLEPDDRSLLASLRELGIEARPAVWDDPGVDWAGYDLVVVRTPWDYPSRRAEFVAWAESVPRLANPADLLRWNTDKHYLRDLGSAGVPVPVTTWFEPGGPARQLPRHGECVVKPVVSAGARDTARYDLAEPAQAKAARRHVEALLAAGRPAMLQPYLGGVDELGEAALVFLGGRFSHAVTKAALLEPARAADPDRRPAPRITPRDVSGTELEVARRVLDAVPGGGHRLLYARVDLIPGKDGAPVLLELEITEPALFLDHAPDGPTGFAAAISARVGVG